MFVCIGVHFQLSQPHIKMETTLELASLSKSYELVKVGALPICDIISFWASSLVCTLLLKSVI